MSSAPAHAPGAAAPPPRSAARTGVLYLNTPTRPPLGADTWIHVLLMRSVDREAFDLHAACAPGRPGAPTPTFQALQGVPGLRVRPVNLGPELFNSSPLQKAGAALATLPAAGSLLGLARHVRRHGIRIIHTSDRPRDAAAAVVLGRLTGARSVVHVHVGCGDWMSPLLRWALARADALVGVSAYVTGTAVAAGYPADRVHTILNAIDVARWDPGLDPAPVRRELGLPAGAPVVLCAARLFRAKGQVDLLRAVAAVRPAHPAVRLVIAGQDYPPGNGHEQELRRLAASLGLADAVTFAGHRGDMQRLMAACDVFALPSVEEPFGLVYAEAGAMGRPVLALRSGGVPEVVEHGGSGLLCPPGDPGALAAQLGALLGDPALRARLGARGRELVLTRFHPTRMARDAEALYARLAPP